MGEWPDSDSDLKRIVEFYKASLRDQPGKPLLEYMRVNNIDLRAAALRSGINKGTVARLISGKLKLTPRQIAKIKMANNIQNSTVPCLADRDIISGAAADTMMMIWKRWLSTPGEPKKTITRDQVVAVQYAMEECKRDASRWAPPDWIGIFQEIRKRLPQSGLKTLDEFTQFRHSCWIHAHCILIDALSTKRKLIDEFEQATNL